LAIYSKSNDVFTSVFYFKHEHSKRGKQIVKMRKLNIELKSNVCSIKNVTKPHLNVYFLKWKRKRKKLLCFQWHDELTGDLKVFFIELGICQHFVFVRPPKKVVFDQLVTLFNYIETWFMSKKLFFLLNCFFPLKNDSFRVKESIFLLLIATAHLMKETKNFCSTTKYDLIQNSKHNNIFERPSVFFWNESWKHNRWIFERTVFGRMSVWVFFGSPWTKNVQTVYFL
jgi:hypothetical protein